MLSPFVPHVAQEMWEMVGENEQLMNVAWPKYDSDALVVSEIELAGVLKLHFYIFAIVGIPGNVSKPVISVQLFVLSATTLAA